MNKKNIHLRKKHRKLSFERKDNPLKKYEAQRLLMVRKINLNDKNTKEISQEIDDYFGSPDKYFKKNSPVTVGKKIIIFDMDDNRLRRAKKLKTEKKNGINLFNHLTNLAASLKNKNDNGLLNNIIGINRNKADFKTKFELINNEKLKLLFDSYKNNSQNNHLDNSIDKSQSLISDTLLYNSNIEPKYTFNDKNEIKKYNKKLKDEIPTDIKNGLNIQSKKLFLLKSSELKNNKISKYLSKKINKPLNNLLLNRIDSFRFKKEMIKEIEFNKLDDNELGKFKWNMSLRRPEHFRGIRKTYVNLKDDKYTPFWSLIIEKSPRQKNLCLKPGYVLSEGEINEFKKQNNYINKKNCRNDEDENIEKQNQYFQTLENLDDIIIKGKNLFNLEYKREILDSKNNKILHKVFMENGKTISLADVNKIYKNDIFYKDYQGFNTEKNERRKFHLKI